MRSMVEGASRLPPLPPHFVRSPSPTIVGEESADIPTIALYIPLARPRPGFWRFNPAHDPEKWIPVFRKDHAPKMIWRER
jgi:hypothetical protein